MIKAAAVTTRADLRRRGGRHDLDAQLLDQPTQSLPTGPIDLQRHEPVGELDHRRVGAECGQGTGGLEAQQAAADDDTVDLPPQLRGAVEHPSPQLGDIVDCAIDETSGQIAALDRRDERVRAGGHDEGVVVERLVDRADLLGFAVDRRHWRVAVQPDSGPAPEALIAQEQVIGVTVAEERRQGDPIVGRTRFLAEDLDVPVLRRVAGVERLDQSLRHHAGADHDESVLAAGLTHEADRRLRIFHDPHTTVSRRLTLSARRWTGECEKAALIREHRF